MLREEGQEEKSLTQTKLCKPSVVEADQLRGANFDFFKSCEQDTPILKQANWHTHFELANTVRYVMLKSLL